MSINSKMTAIADAIRGKTGGTEPLTLDQMAAEIAGIQVGGGSGSGAELIFETTFSVPETLKTANKTTVATIQTGFTKDGFKHGFAYYAVISCINDTETDFSFVHFKERTQMFTDTGSQYFSPSPASGLCFYIKDSAVTCNYGLSYGIWISAVSAYMQSITLQSTVSASAWGTLCSGDYKLKVFRLNNDYFGVEGYGDD